MTRGVAAGRDQVRALCVEAFRAGTALKDIERAYGVPAKTVSGYARDAGLSRHRRLNDAERDEIAAAFVAGESPAAIARRFGVARCTPFDIARKRGLSRGVAETAVNDAVWAAELAEDEEVDLASFAPRAGDWPEDAPAFRDVPPAALRAELNGPRFFVMPRHAGLVLP